MPDFRFAPPETWARSTVRSFSGVAGLVRIIHRHLPVVISCAGKIGFLDRR
jgi:hypothetical protein